MSEDLKIAPFDKSDLDALMKIELASFTIPWSRKSYEDAFAMDDIEIWTAKIESELVGYMVLQFVTDEVDLHVLASKPSFRRQGIARRLMRHMKDLVKARGMKDVFLLVRPSNVAARFLYSDEGFKPSGLRRQYYRDNLEDAILMNLHLDDDSN